MEIPEWAAESLTKAINRLGGEKVFSLWLDYASSFSKGKKALEQKKYSEAKDYFLQAQRICKELKFPDYDPIRCMGDMYLSQGKTKEALQYFKRALAITVNLSPCMDILPNLARVVKTYLDLGENVKAFTCLSQTLKVFPILLPRGTICVLECLGHAYFEEGKSQDAIKYFRQALQQAKKLEFTPNILDNLMHIGDVYLKDGNDKKAFAYFQQALEYIRTDWHHADQDNRYASDCYARAVRAAMQCASHKNAQSDEWLLRSLCLVEESRGMDTIPQLTGYVRSLPKLLRVSTQFSMPTGLTPFPPFEPGAIVSTQTCRIQLTTNHTAQKKDSASSNVEKSDTPTKTVMPELTKEQTQIPELTTTDIAKALKPGTVAIGYFIDQDNLYNYCITKKQQDIIFITQPTKLECSVAQIQDQLKVWTTIIANFGHALAQYKGKAERLQWLQMNGTEQRSKQLNVLSSLYQLLELHRILPQIQNKCNLSRVCLLFSVDGILHGVPWTALFDGQQYLYEKVLGIHNIVSMRLLIQQKTTPLPKKISCVFSGVPYILEKDHQGVLAKHKYLSGVAQEYNTLCDMLGEKNIMGLGYGGTPEYQATPENIRRYHNKGTLFYFSGHGSSDGLHLLDIPLPDGTLASGKLTWKNLLVQKDWNFSNQMIVLLNCCLFGQLENIGKEMPEMISVLFSKGAASVLSALWEIDDQMAPIFMPEFVKNLSHNIAQGKKYPRVQAMKQAIHSLRNLGQPEKLREFDFPYFFSPFFISGIA